MIDENKQSSVSGSAPVVMRHESISRLTTVTLLSKIVSAAVFIALPFIGFLVGTNYGPVIPERSVPSVQEFITDQHKVENVELKFQMASSSSVEMYPSRADLEEFLKRAAPIGYIQKDITVIWPEIRRREFIWQGELGAITQRCYTSHVFRHNPSEYQAEDMCLGSNAIFLEWKNQMVLIDFFQTPNVNNLRFLSDIGFNEGAFTGATSTVHDVATLYVATYQAKCLWNDGMCGESPSLAYKVELPTLSISVPPMFEYPVHTLKRLSWNSDGTRAVMRMSCPEGCPKEETIGVDFTTGKQTVLTYRNESGATPPLQPEDVVWTNNDTVIVRGKEYSF